MAGFEVSTEDEGSKVRQLEWQGPLEQFQSLLQQPTWDHYPGKLRLVLGLVRRPPLLALPGASLSSAAHDAGHLPPAATGSEVDVYVCSDKDGVADTFVKACGGSDAAVEALDRVSYLSQRDLRRRDVAMLGDVYVARRKSELDQPVRWHTQRDENLLVKRLLITIDEAKVGDSLTINLRAYASDLLVISDALLQWNRGSPPTQILEFTQDIGGAWLRAWDAGGRLVAEDAHALLREISFAVTLQTGSLRVEDKLTATTRRALQGGAAQPHTLDRVTTVSRGATVRSTVSTPDEALWSATRRSAAAAVHHHIPAVFDQDAYFPAGADGRAMAILSLAEKIRASPGATLIDPFFDIEGGTALLVRIANLEVPLTIVTWLDTADSPAAAALQKWLLQAEKERVLPTQLRILQLPGKKQPFHDRVLALHGDGVPTIYSLSNSLSGMAKDFSLVVAKLSDGTAWAVQEEIESIIQRAESEGVWLLPDPTAGAPRVAALAERARRHTYFPGWKALLKLAVEPLEDSDEGWVDAACDAGLMRREPSGAYWQLQDPRAAQLRDRLLEALVRGPAQLGLVLQLMGEVDARGILIDAAEISDVVAKTLGSELSATAISDHLRSTFKSPDTSVDRSFVADCFRTRFSRELVEAAFYAWNGRLGHLESWPPDWGREFAFVILGHLNPIAVVRLSEDLQDITPVAGALGRFRRRGGDFAPVARAMLSAKSPFLRAFGAQALSASWTKAHNANHVIAPDDVRKSVADLRTIGHPPIERLTYLVLWSQHADKERRAEIVDELLTELSNPLTAGVSVQGVLSQCLDHASPVVPELVERLKDVLPEAASKIRRSLLAVMPKWLPVSDSRRSERTFYRTYLPICQAFANAASELVRETDQSPAFILEEAMSMKSIEKLTRPVSPLMPRPGRFSAVNALGWVVLSSMMAPSESRYRDAAKEKAAALLSSFGDDLDSELRAVLEELIAGKVPLPADEQ